LKHDYHPDSDELIDLVDGVLEEERRRWILEHLKVCSQCSAYVRSLEATLDMLARDEVPQIEPAFFTYLATRIRAQVQKPTWRRVLLAPGLAAAAIAALLVFVLYAPSPPELDQLDLIMADMTTQELIESMGDDLGYEVLASDTSEELFSMEEYFQGETAYDLLEGLSPLERQHLVEEIEKILQSETSGSNIHWGC